MKINIKIKECLRIIDNGKIPKIRIKIFIIIRGGNLKINEKKIK